jgi:cell division septum initiation protein DivIVA|tara:strand:+ start:1825 stop:2022 length:198 start_codon:yes stop_codon:yes gene_type:complete
MSVVKQDFDSDELLKFVNELESKVLILIDQNKTLQRRIKVLEIAAKKHGVVVGNHEVDKDACIIV